MVNLSKSEGMPVRLLLLIEPFPGPLTRLFLMVSNGRIEVWVAFKYQKKPQLGKVLLGVISLFLGFFPHSGFC